MSIGTFCVHFASTLPYGSVEIVLERRGSVGTDASYRLGEPIPIALVSSPHASMRLVVYPSWQLISPRPSPSDLSECSLGDK